MRCSCPYLGVEQAGNTLSTSLLPIEMLKVVGLHRSYGCHSVLWIEAQAFTCVSVYEQVTGFFQRMNEEHTCWTCICNFPSFFFFFFCFSPRALLWYVIWGLFVRLMHTVHEYNR